MARTRKPRSVARSKGIRKARTGIKGLDEITGGGLPEGRPTLVCGGPGCGKTMLAMEFLARGALEEGEPGVFMTFEETAEELVENAASLGFDLAALCRRRKLVLEYVRIASGEIQETGDYDLEGLFIRLEHAIDTIGAKRVVLDTIESLFSGLSNHAILRAEIARLFRWLKDRGVTAIVTAERGAGALTRHGLEEYVSDCVILLDNRVSEQLSTRRMRVVKYRGTAHGTNEFPFLIDEAGFAVLPISSLRLEHPAPTQRVSSGVADLDVMLGGRGYYRGSTVLISGGAGSGKTSLAAHFAEASARRGERCLYLAFEESVDQIVRNMSSIGIDLGRRVQEGQLEFRAWRPTMHGLETHLMQILRLLDEVRPRNVVVDPVTNLIMTAGNAREVNQMLTRMIDAFKSRGITALLTSLTDASSAAEQTEVGISSLIDTWLLVRDLESNGERNRGLYVIKSRGMAHSNQVREFVITNRGLRLLPVYVGTGGVLTGTSRLVQESQEEAARVAREREIERKRLALKERRKAIEAQIASIRSAFEAERREIEALIAEEHAIERQLTDDRVKYTRSRGGSKERRAGMRKRNGARSGANGSGTREARGVVR